MACSCCHHALRSCQTNAMMTARPACSRARPRRTSRHAGGRCPPPASSRRSCAPARRIRSFCFERAHPHEVPGDLQIVADDRAILLPAPGLVVRPVLIRSVSFTNGLCRSPESSCAMRVERLFQQFGILRLAGREIEVDQVRRRMVADRVPILARPVVAQRRRRVDRATRDRCARSIPRGRCRDSTARKA